MSTQSLIRAGLAQIQAMAPNAVVTVIYKGETATALKSTLNADNALGEALQVGVTTGRVRVDQSLISEPGRGDTILIDGEAAFVTLVNRDPVDAMFTIDYQDQKPVEGI